MGRRGGQGKKGFGAGAIAVVAVIAILATVFLVKPEIIKDRFSGNQSLTIINAGPGQQLLANACPDTLLTALTVDVQNPLNATGSEEFDVTAYVVDGNGAIIATITDTTNPSSTNIPCGGSYSLSIVSTDAANGDNSRIKSVTGPGQVVDGVLQFSTNGPTATFQLYVEQQATLEARAYSRTDAAFMYDDGDASATDYETDGVVFMSTTDNATKYDETSGVDIEYQLRAIQSDTNWNDFGTYILLEMPTASWEVPTVWVDGQKLTDIKAQLNEDEKKAWSSYEYVYKFDKPILDGGEGVTVRVATQLLSGVSSVSADPEIDISSIGQYLSTDGSSVKRGGVKDDSSQTAVRSIFDSKVDMT